MKTEYRLEYQSGDQWLSDGITYSTLATAAEVLGDRQEGAAMWDAGREWRLVGRVIGDWEVIDV